MPIAGTLKLNGCNYQFGWDLISQDVANNTSTVSFYGILTPTGSYVAWSSGTASIHTAQAGLRTRYTQSEVVVQSNFTFPHNADGTLTLAPGYGINTTFTSGSGTVIIQLPQIKRFATITATPSSLTDEDDPYITFTNPGGATNLNVWLEVNPNGEHYAQRNLTITSGTYTWELTEEEREQLRAELTTSNKGTIRLGLYSTQSGTTSASYKDIPYEIINATPLIRGATIDEADEKIVSNNLTRTGYFITGYSDIHGYITSPAEPRKGGRIVKYQMILEDKSVDIPIDTREGIIYDVPKIIGMRTSCEFKAIDNRGNIGRYGVVFGSNSIDYSAIQLDKENCTLERDATGENATLTFNGSFWNSSFGNRTNEIRNITYIIKKADGTEAVGTTPITPTIDGSSFSFSGLIAGDNNTLWNLGDVYEVELTISDFLTSDTITFTLNSFYPNICIDKQGVGIMCAYDSNIGGGLQVLGEVVPSMSDINSLIKLKRYTGTVSVGAGSTSTGSLGNLTSIDGYTYVGIIPQQTGYADQWLVNFSSYSGKVQYMVRNYYSGTLSASISCYVLYMKTSYYNSILVN